MVIQYQIVIPKNMHLNLYRLSRLYLVIILYDGSLNVIGSQGEWHYQGLCDFVAVVKVLLDKVCHCQGGF